MSKIIKINKGSLQNQEKTSFIGFEKEMNNPNANNIARFLVNFRHKSVDKNVKLKAKTTLNQRAIEKMSVLKMFEIAANVRGYSGAKVTFLL